MSWRSWEDPRAVLKRHGLKPQKRFSQNFLTDPQVVEDIARALRPADDEPVVEIGPGAGTLTAALLRAGARVRAVERDPSMRALLEVEFADVCQSERLTIEDGDAANLSLGSGGRVAVCGNLPYAITGVIFRRLVEQREQVARAVLMIQREVADRLMAPAATKAYGAMTVFVTSGYAVDCVREVEAECFHPKPKVDSTVVRLDPLTAPRADARDAAFASVVRAGFGQRRKTLNNALKGVPGGRDALSAAGIDGRRRGETLSVEEFAALAKLLVRPVGDAMNDDTERGEGDPRV